MRAFGMPETDIDAALPEADDEEDAEEDHYAVWPENWETVCVFMALETQWRRNDFSGERVGLDYAATESVMRMMGVKDQTDVFQWLRVMESAALGVMNKGV